jgi:hypothetical protein
MRLLDSEITLVSRRYPRPSGEIYTAWQVRAAWELDVVVPVRVAKQKGSEVGGIPFGRTELRDVHHLTV